MAYSQSVAGSRFNTNKVLTSAVRRCKVPAEQITPETWSIAQDELYLLLNSLANVGVPLWCIEKQLYPLYDGVAALTLDVGTVDVLNSFYRTMSDLSGTDTDTSTAHTVQFTSATAVTTVGMFWTAAAVPLAFERSDDGATWETVQTEVASGSVSGEIDWYDLDSVVASEYFRVRATSGTLGFDQVFLGNNPTEIPLARMNMDNWTNLPNKAFKSERPYQFWFDRQVPQPIMRLWPVPNAQAMESLITVWRHRQIMDVGTLTQELEFPARWYDAVVAGLARRLAREMPEVDMKMIPMLDADAAQAMAEAQAEERDNSPSTFAPNVAMYTA